MASCSSGDERLEQREKDLERQRNELGKKIATERCALALWQKSSCQRRAVLQEQLVYILGQLAELREIRRAMLGLQHNSHIRVRALPNFVADNPGYAKVVADEVPEARAAADKLADRESEHE
ncbi:hypothetical protein IJT17_00790 [bacterium]|nr:hypothetical protein [bacterium]